MFLSLRHCLSIGEYFLTTGKVIVSFEGFLGDYDLVCEDKNVSFKLEKDGETIQIVNLAKTDVLV
ncbi:hypothetical protein QFZ31_002226 [Neobacillus niacini]|uniref:hypothetical protein n=1 Tax=Neobacillus driksii TaxID=3035913 RepID=UPI0027871E38|nr:hypothetical protein [Neobacillus niacini]MDQ0972348.1 hypothetical protein [Neobacillus niacini]